MEEQENQTDQVTDQEEKKSTEPKKEKEGDTIPFNEAFDFVKEQIVKEALTSNLPLDESVVVESTFVTLFHVVEQSNKVDKELVGKMMLDAYLIGMDVARKRFETIMDHEEREIREKIDEIEERLKLFKKEYGSK